MEFAYGLPVVAALLYALHRVRRVAKRNKARRRLLRSAIGGDKIRFKDPEASPRSEMRAYSSPTTVMGEIRTTTSSPGLGHSRDAKKDRKKRRH